MAAAEHYAEGEPAAPAREVLGLAYAVLDDYREAFAREQRLVGDLTRFAVEQASRAAALEERLRAAQACRPRWPFGRA